MAALTDGHHHDLARAEPERPLAGIVLCEDGKHALHTAQHSTMHNDWPLVCVGLTRVDEVKADWQLEIQLNSGALETTLERIIYCVRLCSGGRGGSRECVWVCVWGVV